MVVALSGLCSLSVIHEKMLVFQKELTCHWVMSKHGRIAWKVCYQSHLVPCEIFPVGLDNAVRICDKMQVIYKEKTCHGVESTVAK